MKKQIVFGIVVAVLAVFISANITSAIDYRTNMYIGVTTEQPIQFNPLCYRWSPKHLQVTLDGVSVGNGANNTINDVLGLIVVKDVQHELNCTYDWNWYPKDYTGPLITSRVFHFTLVSGTTEDTITVAPQDDNNWNYNLDERVLMLTIDGPQYKFFSFNFTDPLDIVLSIGHLAGSIIGLKGWDFTLGWIGALAILLNLPTFILGGIVRGNSSGGGSVFGGSSSRSSGRSSFGGFRLGGMPRSIGGKRRGRGSGSYNWILISGVILSIVGILMIAYDWTVMILFRTQNPWIIPSICLLIAGVVISIIGIKRRR